MINSWKFCNFQTEYQSVKTNVKYTRGVIKMDECGHALVSQCNRYIQVLSQYAHNSC